MGLAIESRRIALHTTAVLVALVVALLAALVVLPVVTPGSVWVQGAATGVLLPLIYKVVTHIVGD